MVNKTFATIAITTVSLAGLLAGCSSSAKTSAGSTTAPSSGATPSVAAHGALGVVQTPLGSILTDSSGKTIYRFAIDAIGVSKCTATCLKYWPIVPAPAATPATISGVNAAIGSLTRPDGTKQLTVAGWPVYTFTGDSGPGTTSGQGKNLSGGLWWVVSDNGAAVSSAPSASAATSTTPSSGGGYRKGY
jgi:predicted lipoprotein with Yx(FWY)xxD motif